MTIMLCLEYITTVMYAVIYAYIEKNRLYRIYIYIYIICYSTVKVVHEQTVLHTPA